VLGENTLPFGGNADASDLCDHGRQFVVFFCAGGGKDLKSPSGGDYVAFALPKENELSPLQGLACCVHS